jgi:Methyltransferase domain
VSDELRRNERQILVDAEPLDLVRGRHEAEWIAAAYARPRRGEGRLSRDLKARGHTVVGVDASPTMVAAAREADPAIDEPRRRRWQRLPLFLHIRALRP